MKTIFEESNKDIALRLKRKKIEPGDMVAGQLVDDIDYRKKVIFLQPSENSGIYEMSFSEFDTNRKKSKKKKVRRL